MKLDLEDLITPTECAKLLGVSRFTLKAWRRDKTNLNFFKVRLGRRVMYSRREVLALSKERKDTVVKKEA